MNTPFTPRKFLKFLPAALLLAALLAALPACADAPDPTAPPAAATTAPTAAPRPLTPAEQADIAAFPAASQAISEAQATLRQDLDDWQAALTACHPATAQETLRDFAARFSAVTAQARTLPRGPRAMDLADMLILAAEAEESAFRRLRDRWQPNNTSLFETAELLRAESAAARNSVDDLIRELRNEYAEGPTPQEIEAMQEFAPTFAGIETSWNEAHITLDDLKYSDLEPAILMPRYNDLIGQLSALADTLQTLQPPKAADTLTQNLRQAIAAEIEALENLMELLDFIISTTPGMEPTPEPAPEPTPEPDPVEPAPEATETPPSDTIPPTPAPPVVIPIPPSSPEVVLNALDAAISAAQSALDAASQTIQEIIDDESAEILEAVADFESAYNQLSNEWDNFYTEYNEWRLTDGGCDRIQTLTDLRQFARRAADLSRQTRELPQSGQLLPIQTLLSDAAAREETALRTLSNTWRPFTAQPFINLTQQQTAADTLRRQADTALTQLQTR